MRLLLSQPAQGRREPLSAGHCGVELAARRPGVRLVVVVVVVAAGILAKLQFMITFWRRNKMGPFSISAILDWLDWVAAHSKLCGGLEG